MTMFMLRLISLGMILAGIIWADHAAADEKFFQVPPVAKLPFHLERISSEKKGKAILESYYMDGPEFNGRRSRIYFRYSRPMGDGPYPAVLHIHGSNNQTLNRTIGEYYARNGFACLQFDWEPAGKRAAPHSEYQHSGRMTTATYQPIPLESDRMRLGIFFARRSLDFLRSLPEIDRSNIHVSGVSAGAQLTLLLLGLEPDIRAATVKYGSISGFPGPYVGGIYEALNRVASSNYAEDWLRIYDSANYLANIRSKIYLISGTDDAFYWMPVVLETARRLGSGCTMAMLPNVNHRYIHDESMALEFFRSISGMSSRLPEISKVELNFDGPPEISFVAFPAEPGLEAAVIYKIAPQGKFTFKGHWNKKEAFLNGTCYVAKLPPIPADSQLVAYPYIKQAENRIVTGDTVEFPNFPAWRDFSGRKEYIIAEMDHFLLRGNFEKDDRRFQYRGKACRDKSGEFSRHGKGAAVLPAGMDNFFLFNGLPGVSGKKIYLSGYARSLNGKGSFEVELSWNDPAGTIRKYQFATQAEFAEFHIEERVPVGACAAKLVIRSQDGGIALDNLSHYYQKMRESDDSMDRRRQGKF